jgi:predicted transposase/invertase (TIGR01784 family)
MIISPKYDYAMKELFQNKVVLRFFIGDVLGIPQDRICFIHLNNTFLRKRFQRQKLGILDLVVELNSSIKINIELQVKVFEGWEKRQLFYLSKLYVEELAAGESYDHLRKTIGISILNFNLSEREAYHSVYRLRDEDGEEFSDILEIHILELNKKLTGQGEIDNWIRFFNAEKEEDFKMIKTNNPGIQEAIREMKRMSLNNPLRLRYEAYLKRVRDEQAREMYVEKKGRAEGRAEFILELLEMKGSVPEELQKRIRSERNTDQLRQWFRLAVKSKSVREFQEQLQQQLQQQLLQK